VIFSIVRASLLGNDPIGPEAPDDGEEIPGTGAGEPAAGREWKGGKCRLSTDDCRFSYN